MYINNM